MPAPDLTGDFNYHLRHAAGSVVAEIASDGVRRLYLLSPAAAIPPVSLHRARPASAALHAALKRYFAGEQEDFANVPHCMASGTSFQQEVWQAAREVPWGSTATYGALAERLGRGPGSSRAIGHALGMNPLHLLVPCHRFLGANGSLVDFAGGLHWKQTLLQIEGSYLV